MRAFSSKSIFIMFLLWVLAPSVFAQSVSELEAQIKSRNEDMNNLQSELLKLRSELNVINQKSNTLGNAVSELDTTRKKLLTEIKLAEDKIASTNNSIKILEIEIGDKETSINKAKKAISSGIVRMNEIDSENITYKILSKKNFSEAIDETNKIIDFHKKLRSSVFELRQIQQSLSLTIEEKEQAKDKLLDYKTEVNGQKVVVEKNKTEKESLLKETKNQEAEYQKIIAEKEKLRAQFESELQELESKIQFQLDPKSYPAPKNGIFAWPLDNVLITQRFGLTESSATLYNYRTGAWQGKHAGIDMRANNDKVYAMADGVVMGTGDTDGVCPRASTGVWVLIKYDNGLANTFFHLTASTVKAGQRVKAGDLVAYSGNTGYSTAPHLHIGVMPASLVSVKTWPSAGCPGKMYTTPVVAGSQYLNPLDYLPKTTDAMFK
ncbi:MAG: peptidoglycan DD-metalloendopeptidase family protein [Candidatus Paceibacterota bacterium]